MTIKNLKKYQKPKVQQKKIKVLYMLDNFADEIAWCNCSGVCTGYNSDPCTSCYCQGSKSKGYSCAC